MGYNFIALNMQDCAGGGEIKRNPFDNRRSSFVAYRGPVQRLVWCRVVHMASPRMQPYIRGFFFGFLRPAFSSFCLRTSNGETPSMLVCLSFPAVRRLSLRIWLATDRYVYLKSTLDHVLFWSSRNEATNHIFRSVHDLAEVYSCYSGLKGNNISLDIVSLQIGWT